MTNNSKIVKEVHRLLNNTLIPPEYFYKWVINEDAGELSNLLQPLSNYMKHHSPEKLFKIRRPNEHSISAFEKDMLFLSRAENFNDPYDCLLYFDDDQLHDRIRTHLNRVNIFASINIDEVEFPLENGIQNLDQLLTSIESIRKDFLDMVQSNFQNVTNILQRSTFISCLTEHIDSPIMWSHYGAEHQGFALEYEFGGDYFSPKHYHVNDVDYDWYGWRSLLPVFYSKRRANGIELAEWYSLCEIHKVNPQFDSKSNLSCWLPDLLLKTKLCLNKAEEWNYEKEWRLIVTSEWPNEIEDDSASVMAKPKAVYLGAKIDLVHKSKLISIAKAKNIAIYEMYIDHNSPDNKINFRFV
jgi:hypothetical protein